MQNGRGFKKLIAWQKADDLASAVFRAVQSLPPRHRWLASEAARAAISVPANIAEGYGRGSRGDYLRFLDIARGSMSEVEYYIHFFSREGLLDTETCKRLDEMQVEAGRLLHGLWRSLKAKLPDSWNHEGGTLQIHDSAFDLYEVDV